MKFTDNVALVVGSATGMGRATVRRLVAEGANVIAYDLLADKLEELKEELSGGPGTFEPYGGDVNDGARRTGVIELIREKYGKLDTLVYVAGVVDLMTPAHALDDELWDYVMDVNLNSCFRFIREALPLMRGHDGPAANIIIVSSVGGVVGSSSGAAYITSKHAVLGLMKNLAWTYKGDNLRVNAINPGSFITEIMDNAKLKWPDRPPAHPEGIDAFYKGGANAIRGDLFGKPEDIADAVAFLMSEEAKFICGAELTVDGGWSSF